MGRARGRSASAIEQLLHASDHHIASPIEQLLASLKNNSSTDAGASRGGGETRQSKPPASLSGSSQMTRGALWIRRIGGGRG
jgi:hypothetical protein